MKKYVFIVGNSRSGTTMMSRILNNHSKVFSFKELHFFGRLWSRADRNKSIKKEDAVILMSKLLCSQYEGIFSESRYSSYLNESLDILKDYIPVSSIKIFQLFLEYISQKNLSEICCVKTPRNIFYIKEILEYFPDALVINMIRDPRSVLLSQKNKWKRRRLGSSSVPFLETLRSYVNYHPYIISKLWNSSVAISNDFISNPRVLDIYFEDLVLTPDSNINKICKMIGVDHQERMKLVPNVGSSVDQDNKQDLGFDLRKVSRWKKGGLNLSEIYICQFVCFKFMKTHRYDLVSLRMMPFASILYILSFPIKLVFAFILNVNRVKNIREALINRLKFRNTIFSRSRRFASLGMERIASLFF